MIFQFAIIDAMKINFSVWKEKERTLSIQILSSITMAEVKLERARDLIEAWREDSSADVTVRSDEVEELVHFVRQNLMPAQL